MKSHEAHMTDDEILKAAAEIQNRRLNQNRHESFNRCATVMIRWDAPGAPCGKSYISINILREHVQDVVDEYFMKLTSRQSDKKTPTIDGWRATHPSSEPVNPPPAPAASVPLVAPYPPAPPRK